MCVCVCVCLLSPKIDSFIEIRQYTCKYYSYLVAKYLLNYKYINLTYSCTLTISAPTLDRCLH